MNASGKVQLSRSGTATINGTVATPRSSIVLTGVALSATSFVTVTVQKNVGGVWVRAAVRTSRAARSRELLKEMSEELIAFSEGEEAAPPFMSPPRLPKALQHATATCCRTCLERWHGIPAGRPPDEAEQAYVVEAICRWITETGNRQPVILS